MHYKWPDKEGYPEDFAYFGPSLSFLKNRILRYAFLKRFEIGLDLSLPDLSEDSVVLEVGAGPGFLLPEVASRSGIVIDLDYFSAFLNAVKKMALYEGIARKLALIRGDILHLPFEEETFDIIYCFSVLEHVSLKGVKEMHRVLKTAGILIAGIPIETMFSNVGRIIFRTGGHKKGEVLNSHRAIERELTETFTIEQFKRVPINAMPDFCSLYDVLRCRKL